MSELINGIKPFTLKDLVIINRFDTSFKFSKFTLGILKLVAIFALITPPHSLSTMDLLLLGAFFLYIHFMEQPIPPKKVVFYFDGFNFYHGFKAYTLINSDWKNYYWLDFVKFCSQFVFEHDNQKLHKVKYFTAPPKNVQKRSKQNALFSANTILNGDLFEVINGHYSDKFIDCHATCKEQFIVPEEKCTDVNLALAMVNDCIEGNVDVITLVTADSDQVSTIKYIQNKFPQIKIKVYFPPERKSNEIRLLMKTVVFMENLEDKFKNAKMPGEVSGEINGQQKKYTRPEDWKK